MSSVVNPLKAVSTGFFSGIVSSLLGKPADSQPSAATTTATADGGGPQAFATLNQAEGQRGSAAGVTSSGNQVDALTGTLGAPKKRNDAARTLLGG